MFKLTFAFGIIGLLIFIKLITSVQRLLKNDEGAYIHLLMALMYVCWLPIPIVSFIKFQKYDFLIIGAIFGTLSLVIGIMVMILQASHLSYSKKEREEDPEFWNRADTWVLNGLIGSQAELLMGALKGLWIIIMTVSFILERDIVLSLFGVVFALLNSVYFLMLYNDAFKRESKIKLNMLVINIECVIWYTMMAIIILIK